MTVNPLCYSFTYYYEYALKRHKRGRNCSQCPMGEHA